MTSSDDNDTKNTLPTRKLYQRPANSVPLCGSAKRVRYESRPCGPLLNSISWLPGHGIHGRSDAEVWMLLPKSAHTAGCEAGFRLA